MKGMKKVLKMFGAGLLSVLFVSAPALGLEGRPPARDKSGKDREKSGSTFAPGESRGKPALIIRGKGGKITDVERRGGRPKQLDGKQGSGSEQ